MHPRLAHFAMGLTATFVLASLGLILAGLAGFGASLPLTALFLVVTGFLYAGRQSLAAFGRIAGTDVGAVLAVAWAGTFVAAALVLVSRGASPAELSAIGGLAGLLGMLNYFLRPIYGLLYAAGRYLDRALTGRGLG